MVNTSISTLRRLSEGNYSYIPLKSKGTKAPVASSVFIPIVPPVYIISIEDLFIAEGVQL